MLNFVLTETEMMLNTGISMHLSFMSLAPFDCLHAFFCVNLYTECYVLCHHNMMAWSW